MPKIRDLGINVIPETMRPPEIGPGGGWGGGCQGTYGPDCPNTTFPPTTTGPHWTCGFWTCGRTQDCPNTTFPTTTGPQNYPGYANVPGCPNTTIVRPSDVTCYGPPGLTREAIQQLKEQLQRQIAQLDEYAKNIGPKTPEEIDAREKQLREELEDLERRRNEYKRSE